MIILRYLCFPVNTYILSEDPAVAFLIYLFIFDTVF